MGTPYDGKVGLWHFVGEVVGEPDIESLARTVRQWAPAADAIWVKTSDGNTWQGAFDEKASMAINGPQDISRWISVLAGHGLEFHAWCNLVGQDIQGEIARIVEACRVPGVKSMILDVEPHPGHWTGSREDAVTLMTGVRNALGTNFHIGISVDPRRNHYDRIFPDAWRPFVNSVHPQIYWEEMKRTPRDVLDETYVVWGNYGLPIYPALQGGAEPNSIRRAQEIARSVRGAMGLSYFRLGVIGPLQFPVINEEFIASELGPDSVLRRYAWEQIVAPYESGYMDGVHEGDPATTWKEFTCVRGHEIKHKPTEARQDFVWAQWTPGLPAKGMYEISVYIPGNHATTQEARYHIHGISGVGTELLVRLNQSMYSNQWVPMVVYEFTGGPGSGRVNLTDLTGETGKEIAFGAVRWRQVIEQKEITPAEGAGFDPPVGTAEERLSGDVWPGDWYDATGFGTFYEVVGRAYHTGADLNLSHDLDRNTPIYAPADGVVTFSGRSIGTWGWLIVIRHDPLPDGQVVWSRSAHVTNPIVREGDRVIRGQQIANIGNADGKLAWHLHFDIAKTSVLEGTPGHWPGENLGAVYEHYLDPRKFIEEHRPPGRG